MYKILEGFEKNEHNALSTVKPTKTKKTKSMKDNCHSQFLHYLKVMRVVNQRDYSRSPHQLLKPPNQAMASVLGPWLSNAKPSSYTVDLVI